MKMHRKNTVENYKFDLLPAVDTSTIGGDIDNTVCNIIYHNDVNMIGSTNIIFLILFNRISSICQ